MKLVKNILLGSAIGICFAASLHAADLPARKTSSLEYVRVCSEHGQGFFHVPGSDSCLKIGGRVRSDTMYVQTNDRSYDSLNFAAQGRIYLDVRSNTPYGTVRSYLRYSLTRSDNNYGDGFNNGNSGVGSYGGVDQAYIQFAGLTAGRVSSFFDFYADSLNFAAIRSSDVMTQLLAYTVTFDKGWSLTFSVEDGNERRIYSDASFVSPYGNGSIQGALPAGQSMPDAVAALMVSQEWGSAQLSAALHQVRPAYLPLFSGADDSIFHTAHEEKYGFALHGGVKFNLPMIAPGNELWFEAAYAEGAIGYLGAGNYNLAQGDIALPMTDAFIDARGNLKKTRGWSALMAFMHYWTPSVRQSIFGSFMQLDYGRSGYAAYGVASGSRYSAGFIDAAEWRAGTNLIWSPTKDFDIGIEVIYTYLDPKRHVLRDSTSNLRTIGSDDAWQGRLRFQRVF